LINLRPLRNLLGLFDGAKDQFVMLVHTLSKNASNSFAAELDYSKSGDLFYAVNFVAASFVFL
jgi:hypothetical protein